MRLIGDQAKQYTYCQRTGLRIPLSQAVVESWSGLVVHRDHAYDNPAISPDPEFAPIERSPLWRPEPEYKDV